MGAWYNEVESYAVDWLKRLIQSGAIAEGQVDGRGIQEIVAGDCAQVVQAHFFAGIGGWSHALRLAGWPDELPVWTGSCPCQPFSAAGKRGCFSDERHLWPEWFRLIRECRPPVIFGEQVASPDGLRWFDLVSFDLEGAGYAVGAADLCAAGVGAPHIRQRLYFVAVSDRERRDGLNTLLRPESGAISETAGDGTVGVVAASRGSFWSGCDWFPCADGKVRPVEPGSFPLAHGVPARVGRLRAYGNAIVPQVAATFIRAVMEVL